MAFFIEEKRFTSPTSSAQSSLLRLCCDGMANVLFATV
jgi:hypothetical protein